MQTIWGQEGWVGGWALVGGRGGGYGEGIFDRESVRVKKIYLLEGNSVTLRRLLLPPWGNPGNEPPLPVSEAGM